MNHREETFNQMNCLKIREICNILIVFDIPLTSLTLQCYVADIGFLVTFVHSGFKTTCIKRITLVIVQLLQIPGCIQFVSHSLKCSHQ